MEAHPGAAITEYFAELTDPRVERTKRHLLLDILVIALCNNTTGDSLNSVLDTSKPQTRIRCPHAWILRFRRGGRSLSIRRHGALARASYCRPLKAIRRRHFCYRAVSRFDMHSSSLLN
jgi:hypothetical protein